MEHYSSIKRTKPCHLYDMDQTRDHYIRRGTERQVTRGLTYTENRKPLILQKLALGVECLLPEARGSSEEEKG